MYKVYFTNFDYYLDGGRGFLLLEAAIAASKKAGFETTIYQDDKVVAGWHIIYGTRYF